MTDDIARTILLVHCAVVAPLGIYFRLRSVTDEKLDRRQEGWPILVGLRALGAAFAAGVLIFLVNPDWMAWASMDLPSWARWTGVGSGILSAVLLLWAFHSLGHNLTDTVVTRRNATLVKHGPY